MLVNRMLARLAGDDPVRALLVYRAVLVMVHIASLLLIVSLLGRLRPQLRLAGVIVYGWNPIVALFAQSKTDTIMVFFLLAAVALLMTGRRRIALVPLVLSAFVKLITLPLLAIAVMQRLRSREWRAFILDTAIILGTVVAIYLPFARSVELVVDHLGLDEVVAAATGLGAGGEAGPAQVSNRFVAHLGLVPLVLWGIIVLRVGFARQPTWSGLMRGWAIITLLLVVLFSKLEFSWYLMTPLALASLAGSGPLTAVAIFVSFSSLLFNAWQSASAGSFALPHLLEVPRAAVHLGWAAAATLGVLAFSFAAARVSRER
jgi:hypothetical protein